MRLFSKKKVGHPSDCSEYQRVLNDSFDMIVINGNLSTKEIVKKVQEGASRKWGLGFYVVSHCPHDFPRNNKFMINYQPDNMVEVEFFWPQGCLNYVKSIAVSELMGVLSNIEKVINAPLECGFVEEEWS